MLVAGHEERVLKKQMQTDRDAKYCKLNEFATIEAYVVDSEHSLNLVHVAGFFKENLELHTKSSEAVLKN